MRVIAVTTEHYYSGILVPDLETVKKALYAYSDGVSSASNATRAQQPGMTLMMLDAVQPHGNSFVDNLYRDIESTLSERSSFLRGYDYDGVGRFLKTTVKVNKVDDGYVVGFNAAYVGNKPEEEIAEYLGAIRGLYRSEVAVTLDAAEDDQFVIDFQPIMDALEGSVFTGPSASEVATLIASGYKEEWSSITQRGGIVQLFDLEDGMFAGTLQIDDITVGKYYEQPFVANGSTVTGALRNSWSEEHGFEKPVLRIRIGYPVLSDNGILDPSIQSQIVNLTNELSTRLSSLIEEVVSTDA